MLKSLKEWDHGGLRVKFFLLDPVPDRVHGRVRPISEFNHEKRKKRREVLTQHDTRSGTWSGKKTDTNSLAKRRKLLPDTLADRVTCWVRPMHTSNPLLTPSREKHLPDILPDRVRRIRLGFPHGPTHLGFLAFYSCLFPLLV